MTESESRCVQADMGEALVAYLHQECEPDECRRVEAHLAACAACSDELEALRATHVVLGAWTTPEPKASIRVVSEEQPARLRWRRLYDARWELATAATVLLAVGVVLAGAELRYEPDALVLRLGFDREVVTPVLDGEPGDAPGPDTVLVEAGSNVGAARETAPWQADLAALESELRELVTVGAVVPPNGRLGPGGQRVSRPGLVRGPVGEPAEPFTGQVQLMDRVQGMIEQSERRQQQELALWLSEFAREFDVQRLADQQRMQQELDALEGYADYLVRVVGTPSPR